MHSDKILRLFRFHSKRNLFRLFDFDVISWCEHDWSYIIKRTNECLRTRFKLYTDPNFESKRKQVKTYAFDVISHSFGSMQVELKSISTISMWYNENEKHADDVMKCQLYFSSYLDPLELKRWENELMLPLDFEIKITFFFRNVCGFLCVCFRTQENTTQANMAAVQFS